MAVTLADVDRWDPNLIREAFRAVMNRSDAAADVHMNLASLPAFLTWDGDAAHAAQVAINQARTDLLLHSQEAAIVSMRAYDAVEMIEDVQKKLRQADEDAQKWHFKIDRITGSVMPLDPATIGQPDTTVHFVELGSRVQQILVEANAADIELARAINTADGVEPVTTDAPQGRQQAIDESIDRALREAQLPPGVDPNLIRSVLQDTSKSFPDPRVGELGIPGYPDATLSTDQARNVYTYGEQQMKSLNQRLIDQGVTPEARAKTLYATRNALRSWTRDLMVDRGLAESLNANEKNFTWDEITEKYGQQGLKGDELWNKIIDSSMRSRASVNASLGVDPEDPVLPPLPSASGPAGPAVPIPEVPELPAPEVPPVISEMPLEIPPMPIIEP
jgi:hypothetical protein